MILEHYSDKPLSVSDLYDLGHSEQAQEMKPNGLWVSVQGEEDWPSWCRSEDFQLENLMCRHTVTLKPEANILYINSAQELKDFDEEWNPFQRLFLDRFKIKWPSLSWKYDGIIITKHFENCRDDLLWYSAWDCASGCIWNAKKAIADIQLVPVGRAA